MSYRVFEGVTTRLVCLDMAGTTVDDGDAVIRAFRQAMFDAGVPEHSEELHRAERVVIDTMGQSKLTVFRLLFAGEESVAQFANQRFEAAYESIIAGGGVRAMPRMAEFFGAVRDLGIRICLTTGFSPTTRQAIIDSLDWHGMFDLALSPADAGRGRPSADMILTAFIRLGIDDVREMAVAGDTTSDLMAGWRSGAGIVAGVLTGAHNRSTLASVPHTQIVDTIWDLLPALGDPKVPTAVTALSPEPRIAFISG